MVIQCYVNEKINNKGLKMTFAIHTLADIARWRPFRDMATTVRKYITPTIIENIPHDGYHDY